MKNKKSDNTTIETLSAYLDGQLPEEELQAVHQRLVEDAYLRSQLDDLRQARYVLKNTPRLKRRRSFVLSPEMVRQQKTFLQAMNVSRAISAVASVLLVVALGSQYLVSGGMRFAAAPAADMAESANYDMADAVTAEEPMMMEAPEEMQSNAAPLEDEAAAVGEVAEEPAEEAAEAPLAPAAEEEPAADGSQETPKPSGGGGLPPTPTQELEQTVGSADITITPEVDQRGLQLNKDGDDTAEEGEAIPTFEEMLPTSVPIPKEVTEPDNQISTLQIIQGVLLLLALAGGLTAAYFRKKVR